MNIKQEMKILNREPTPELKKESINPSERNDLFFGISHLRHLAQEERKKK